jgi:3-deoxy-D-manno-octulosonate 8-phosphate phosphatase (KDO 8-P phosphatase)
MAIDYKLDWLFLDVDGVLTDGSLVYGADGEEVKIFNVLDGYGIMKTLKKGIKIAIISGRGCAALDLRLSELNVTEIYTNCPNKTIAFDSLFKKYGSEVFNSAHIGDDEPDLDLFQKVRIKVAVANAHVSVLNDADIVLNRSGGQGAVREFCDLLC